MAFRNKPVSQRPNWGASPGAAQPQQPQPQGTPYNPQQGGGAFGGVPASAAQPPKNLGALIAYAPQQGAPDARPLGPQQAPAFSAGVPQHFDFSLQPGRDYPMPEGLGPAGPQQQFPQPSQQAFPTHPLAGVLPNFQFAARDFAGNVFDNPNDFNRQQGAFTQALNNQRGEQIMGLFGGIRNQLSPLNPMAAYQQSQQMLQGGWQNPFAMPQNAPANMDALIYARNG
jgi:hypothetical protein